MTTSTTGSAVARGFSFFRRFLQHPREVGALVPSTRHLGAQMVKSLSLRPGDVVLEYGPGTGSLTQVIAELVGRAKAHYLGIERDPEFVAILQRRFPGLDFAIAQVEDVRTLVQQRGLAAPKAILSGLPLILLPSMPAIVATAADLLAPGGEFRTFSYLQSYPLRNARRLRAMMREHFAAFRLTGPFFTNFPPAFVLHGSKAAD
jgi:phosphatidylethanolamine/phosphatidyl-N-methylethanolamine N-methyltransferase